MWRSVALLVVPLLIASAFADDRIGRYAVKGSGTVPCATYTVERASRSNTYVSIGGWIEGFVTGHNRYAPQTYDVTSFESTELLLELIAAHCARHPDDRLHAVVSALLTKLAPDRLQERSARVRISDGTRMAILYVTTIRSIQSALAERKLYRGEIDGIYTDATRAAIIAFQTDLKFAPTGFPDQATLWRLLRSSP